MSFAATTWAVRQKVPALAKLVLLLLADRHNGDTNRCDPSMDRLADDCGMSKDSVKRQIKVLSDRGLIRVIPRFQGTTQLTNLYAFRMEDMRGVGANSTPGVGANSTPNQESYNQEERRGVTSVFNYYTERVGKSPTYTLTSLRMQKGLARLRECVKKTGNLKGAIEMMMICVDTIAASKFHMGDNAQKKTYNDWEDQLFGSESRLEKWLEEAQR